MATIDHPIIGFRSFVPDVLNGSGMFKGDGSLRSRFGFSHVWQRGENQAECRQHEHKVDGKAIRSPEDRRVRDTVPSTECTCGFYAHHTYQESLDYMQQGMFGMTAPPCVYAIVKGWGRIQVHYDGFRSQYMEILAIVPGVNPDYDKKVSAFYGVPYITGNVEIMASEFGKRAPIESRPTWEETKMNAWAPPTITPLNDKERTIVAGFVAFYLTSTMLTLAVASIVLRKVAQYVLR